MSETITAEFAALILGAAQRVVRHLPPEEWTDDTLRVRAGKLADELDRGLCSQPAVHQRADGPPP